MTLTNLLACKSLRYARIIVLPKDLTVPVTGINIIEATDIEKWAKKGHGPFNQLLCFARP